LRTFVHRRWGSFRLIRIHKPNSFRGKNQNDPGEKDHLQNFEILRPLCTSADS
jgi:hypothetical protein